MQIKWLRKALENLDEEAEYIAKDDPRATQLVVQRIQQTFALLTNNLSLGRPSRLPKNIKKHRHPLLNLCSRITLTEPSATALL